MGWINCHDDDQRLSYKGPFAMATELHTTHAKKWFMWSQMQRTDEVKRATMHVTLTFVEFMEAVARAAESVFPTASSLQHGAHTSCCRKTSRVWWFQSLPTFSRK